MPVREEGMVFSDFQDVLLSWGFFLPCPPPPLGSLVALLVLNVFQGDLLR